MTDLRHDGREAASSAGLGVSVQDSNREIDPPTPQGGSRPAAGGESLRGLSEISGTENIDSQATTCTSDIGQSEPTQDDLQKIGGTDSVDVQAATCNPTSHTSADILRIIKEADISSLTNYQKTELLKLYDARKQWESENMLLTYSPYEKQKQFHAAGSGQRERLLMAANQSGKTYSAAAEVAYHLTGLYPEWWAGKVFTYPPRGLAAGITAQLVRDSMQVLLCGYPAKPIGHGMIPKKCMVSEPVAARSITGAYDTIRVKHVAGGESVLYFRAYEQGREKVQAMTLDFVWLDEEPDADYYTEALTRTNVAFGPVFMTFTPLKGMSETVSRFLLHKQGHVTSMTIDDVGHYTQAQKEAIIAQYPPHEREARTKGVPALGSGRVYPVPESTISVPAFPIPDHWPRLCGMDFGWQHPTAAVWIAHDLDTDVVYVYDTYRAKEQLIPAHAAAIRGRGDWIPVSWPHDGYQVRDAMQGEQLRQQYAAHGVAMRPIHAQFAETGLDGERKTSRISTEAAIQEILTRMETSRLFVFSHLADWFEEFRLYHRKEGLLVKEMDDLMSATHKVIMDLRFAVVKPNKHSMVDHNRRSDPYC